MSSYRFVTIKTIHLLYRRLNWFRPDRSKDLNKYRGWEIAQKDSINAKRGSQERPITFLFDAWTHMSGIDSVDIDFLNR